MGPVKLRNKNSEKEKFFSNKKHVGFSAISGIYILHFYMERNAVYVNMYLYRPYFKQRV